MNLENTNSSYEIVHSSADDAELRAPSKLKSIGKRAVNFAYVNTGMTYASYTVIDFVKPELAPSQAVTAAVISGVAIGAAGDKIISAFKDRKARKEASEATPGSVEIAETNAKPE